MARNFACRPSEILLINCEMTALDFDRAANYRLIKFDNKREFDRRRNEAQLYNEAMQAAIIGASLKFEDEEMEETDLSSIPIYE